MLEGIVQAASNIIGCELPSIESTYASRVLRKATTIRSDSTHPANHLFFFNPSPMENGSDPSEPEPPALVTVSTQK